MYRFILQTDRRPSTEEILAITSLKNSAEISTDEDVDALSKSLKKKHQEFAKKEESLKKKEKELQKWQNELQERESALKLQEKLFAAKAR